MKFAEKYQAQIIFSVFLVLITILRFIPISFGDLYTDNAINSFRAYGWFDYLGNSGQSTPFGWLGYIPTWGILSFHDAPPVAFLIQHIFFIFFGSSTVIARLPFVLAGITSIFLVYYFIKKLIDRNVALLASLIYTISSYSIWAGQAGYLEGIEEMFIVGSILFGGYYFINEKKPRFFYGWILFAVGAILTKYTAIFLIPPILIYIYLYGNTLVKYWKHTVITIILALILISPITIYNFNMYKLRGHFDAALSSMIGMHPQDFSIISDRAPSLNIIGNFGSFFNIIIGNMSYPLSVLFLTCLMVLIFNVRKKGWRSFESWILINFLFLILLFCFSPSANRFLSIAVPFIVIITALGIFEIYRLLNNSVRRIIFIFAVGFIILFELFYAFNTHVLPNSIGRAGWFHSNNKVLNLGFNQLDRFIRSAIISKLPPNNKIKAKEDTVFTDSDVRDRSVVIFDDRILWFSQMWYFQKYFLYYRWPIISTAYISTSNESAITIEDLMLVSGQPLYFIYPINDMVIDPIRNTDEPLNAIGQDLAKRFDLIKSATTTIIKNKNEITVFKIYKITDL